MTYQTSPSSVDATPAALLRQLASRAYRMLKTDLPNDRCEVLALLDEISRSRLGFDPTTYEDLSTWFDRLEDQVAGLLPDDESDEVACPPAGHTCCHGVGIA